MKRIPKLFRILFAVAFWIFVWWAAAKSVGSELLFSQEYLDRQDRYNLIFFLDSTNDPQQPYICLQMKVNGWMIRINNAELDK